MLSAVRMLGVSYVFLFLLSCAVPPAHTSLADTPSTHSVETTQPVLNLANQQAPMVSQPINRNAHIVVAPQPTAMSTSSLRRHYASFDDWKQDFMAKAQQRYGNTALSLFGQANSNERVLRLDASQAEFDKMPWEYLQSAISHDRISQGRQKRREMLDVLDRAESRYGVPASVVTAIWGIESSYGTNMGNFKLIDALSSLAYDGRRREFAESQLMAIVELVNQGDVNQSQLVGSWAGGMGHTQFIPKTWLSEAVDGDGDGRRNPFNQADALTSTASYLANAGWIAHLPAYIEVSLPDGFDYRRLGTRQSLDTWRYLGLSGRSGQPLTGHYVAHLWLPAGIHGPILLTTQNFEAIKVYNNSSNYALAVSALANHMNKKTAFYAQFPKHERPLSRHQVQRLQHILTASGFDTKGTDGVVGTNTRRAFAQWQSANGYIPDGFISQSTTRTLLY